MLNSQLALRGCGRLAAAAALLAGTWATAHAGGVAVSVGLPVAGGYASFGAPVGLVQVGFRGGRGGYHGGHSGGYYRGSGGWGLGVGLGVGLLLAAPWYAPPPTTVIIEQPSQPAAVPPPLPQPGRPEPVIYPRNGQTAQELEADRQACNRWATTQPAALNDSSVFMRAVDACMDGRGYTTK